MNRGVTVTSPVRKSFAPKSIGDAMLSNSAFFGPASPSKNQAPEELNTSKDITDNTHSIEQTMTPLSMYNQSFNINKELQRIIEQLRLELTEQRAFVGELNKSYAALQCKYNALQSKMEALHSEKHELIKDLDLALERERTANKEADPNIVNEYRHQIDTLRQRNSQLHEERVSCTQMMAAMDCLSSKVQQQHSKSEAAALRLEKFHKLQEVEVASLRSTVTELKRQRADSVKFLHHFMTTLPPQIRASDDQIAAIQDWDRLKDAIYATAKNMNDVLADHERTEQALRSKLTVLRQEGATETEKDRMDSLEIENIALKEELKKRTKEAQRLVANNKMAEESVATLSAANAAAKDTVAALQSQIAAMTAEKEVLCAERQRAITEKVSEIEISSKHIAALKVDIGSLSASNEQVTMERAAEKQKNSELAATIEAMRSEMAENEANNQQNIGLSLSLTAEKERLTADNEEQSALIASLREQVEAEKAEKERIASKRDQIADKYNELKTAQEIKALNDELDTAGDTKRDIMRSYIRTDALQNRAPPDSPDLRPKGLTVEIDATPSHSKLCEQLTLEKEQLVKECGAMKRRLLATEKLNRDLKDKFRANKKSTICKYEQIGKKVATMREMITAKETECASLKNELEVSHRQFFKLLHHSASKHDVSTAGDQGDREDLDLSNLEEMRKQLKVLERNFNI